MEKIGPKEAQMTKKEGNWKVTPEMKQRVWGNHDNGNRDWLYTGREDRKRGRDKQRENTDDSR